MSIFGVAVVFQKWWTFVRTMRSIRILSRKMLGIFLRLDWIFVRINTQTHKIVIKTNSNGQRRQLRRQRQRPRSDKPFSTKTMLDKQMMINSKLYWNVIHDLDACSSVCVCVSRVRILNRCVKVSFLVFSLTRTAHILCWTVRANKTPVITCHNVIDAIYRIQRVVRLHNMCSNAVSQSFSIIHFLFIISNINSRKQSHLQTNEKRIWSTRQNHSKVLKNI